MSTKHLKITLTRGLVGKKESQEKVIRALGLRKYGSSVVHSDTPTIRGMINKVHHLVTVAENASAPAQKVKPIHTKRLAKPSAKHSGAKSESKASHTKTAESNS
jgi:large subunit ribosomal protein L30